MHHGIVDWIPPGSAYGLPLNETTLAEKMKSAGYDTHMAGKWHLGFYRWDMTPTFRGFNSFLGFYAGGEDYFTHMNAGHYDFRRDPRPFCGENCSEIAAEDQGTYSTFAFTREAIRVVREHDAKKTNTPLFLYLAYQGVHAPAEAPEAYVNAYNDTIADPKRRTFAGMLSAVDEGIGNVTAELKRLNMFDDTLVVFTSDNGGPIKGGDAVGARNWPLRGGKHSVWEGGVRATAFVSGRGVAEKLKGGTFDGLMHGADWFPTLADVAGFDLNGTLPLDGVSQFSFLFEEGRGRRGNGDGHAQREEVVLGNATDLCSWKAGDPRRARYETAAHFFDDDDNNNNAEKGCGFAIRVGSWKLIQNYGGSPDNWCNTSAEGDTTHCRVNQTTLNGASCPNGYCLFNVADDPFELNECSKDHETEVEKLRARLNDVLDSYRQYEIDPACPTATFANNSVVGSSWAPWCV
eukprot:g4453.t1